MLLGRPPYSSVPAHTLPDMLRSGLASPIIEIPTTRTPDWLTNLLRACFSQNPASRPSFADIVKAMDEGINRMRSASTAARPLANSSPSQSPPQRPQSSVVSPVAVNQAGVRISQPVPPTQVRASTPPRIQPKVLTGDAFPPTEPTAPAAPADLLDTLDDISKISI
jgi:serine/threonine protein kinase